MLSRHLFTHSFKPISVKISIIIPVYNEAQTLREIIRRVNAAPYDKEIILIDDYSSDGSRKILEELGCEYKGKLKMLMTRMVGLDPSKSGILNSVKHQSKAYKFEPIFVFYKGQ